MTPPDIEAVRRMTMEEKFLAGARLFEKWETRCKAILRSHYPHATHADILGMLRRHIDEEEAREYRSDQDPV